MHLFRPVPKKDDRSNPSNYCPNALTSAVAKVFETLLISHFIKHLESNNLLSDHQYGFHKARSTGDLQENQKIGSNITKYENQHQEKRCERRIFVLNVGFSSGPATADWDSCIGNVAQKLYDNVNCMGIELHSICCEYQGRN